MNILPKYFSPQRPIYEIGLLKAFYQFFGVVAKINKEFYRLINLKIKIHKKNVVNLKKEGISFRYSFSN